MPRASNPTPDARRSAVRRLAIGALALAGAGLALRFLFGPGTPAASTPHPRSASPPGPSSGDPAAVRPAAALTEKEREAAARAERTPVRQSDESGSPGAQLRREPTPADPAPPPAPPPGRVQGRLVREGDGSGIAGVALRLVLELDSLEPWSPAPDLPEVVTAPDGSFAWTEVPPGKYALRSRPRPDLPAVYHRLTVAPAELVQLVVAAPAGRPIRGQVVDADTGRPVGGALVALSPELEGAAQADVEGRFLLRVPDRSAVVLYARAPGYALRQKRIVPPEDGADGVRIELRPGRSAFGRVVDPSGSPLAGALVLAHAEEWISPSEGWQRERVAAHTGEDGRFRLPAVRTDLRPVLVVEAPPYASAVLDFPLPGPDAVDFGTIVLSPAGRLVGRLRSTDDRPLAGWHVKLTAESSDEELPSRAHRRRPHDMSRRWFDERTAGSDASGGFVFERLEPGKYRLEARPNERSEPAVRSVEVRAGETSRVELEVDRGAVLEGTIACSDGGPVPVVYVSIDPISGGRSADVRAVRHGTSAVFRAEGLTPGALYRLTFYPYPTADDKAAGRTFAPAVLEGVAAGSLGVHVVLTVSSGNG